MPLSVYKLERGYEPVSIKSTKALSLANIEMAQSSLLGELEVEVEIKSPAAKFYHMYAGRPHHVAKATPRNVQACDLHDGEWGEVGSIIFWNYVHGI